MTINYERHRRPPRKSTRSANLELEDLAQWVNFRLAGLDRSELQWIDAAGARLPIQAHPAFVACRQMLKSCLIFGPQPPHSWMLEPDRCVLDVTARIGPPADPSAIITHCYDVDNVLSTVSWRVAGRGLQ